MACGRIDERVAAMSFWNAVFGAKMTPDQMRAAHPLRSLEPDLETDVADAETRRKAESNMGWAVLFAGLGITPDGKRLI